MGNEIFKGIKVANFAWAGVGPLPASCLAGHGATVVRIESSNRPDVNRGYPPFKDNVPGVNRSLLFNMFNTNFYGMLLDMGNAKGLEVAIRLIEWADVLAEAYTPGVMAKWGLGYEDVKKIKPDIVYYSTCGFGQSGPYAKQPGHGGTMTAVSGLNTISGWPDRQPSPLGGISDVLNVHAATVALVAALIHRRRTGKGIHIDLSQYEGCVYLSTPALLDQMVNKREWERRGNRNHGAAPHGVYRCQGDDRWCAIQVRNEEEWHAFCQAVGNPPWTKEERFASLIGRKENEDDLDRLIEEWTVQHPAEEVMAVLQQSGVAAGAVLDAEGTFNDPQLQLRKQFTPVDHPEIGKHRAYDWAGESKLSKNQSQIRMPAPLLGEHTEYVCTEILGISKEEFDQLSTDGAFG